MQKVEGQSSRMVRNDNGNKRNDFSKQWRITTGLRRLRSLAQNRLFLPLSLPSRIYRFEVSRFLFDRNPKLENVQNFCVIFISVFFFIKFGWKN